MTQQTTQPKAAGFRVPNPVDVQNAADAQLARVILAFDDLDALMADILRRWNADMRPAELRTRLGDVA